MAPKARSGIHESALRVAAFAHVLFLAIFIMVLVWLLHFRDGLAFKADNKQKIFNLHPLLMVLGFVLLSGEAMMVYRSNPAPRKNQKAIHGVLLFLAFVAAITGLVAVFKYHHDLSIPDMYTLHSWLGLSTVVLFTLQFLFGFATFVFPRGDSSTRGKFSPWHVMAGLLIFFMAILSSITGLIEKFIFLGLQRTREALIINFTALLIFLYAVSVSFTVLHRYALTDGWLRVTDT